MLLPGWRERVLAWAGTVPDVVGDTGNLYLHANYMHRAADEAWVLHRSNDRRDRTDTVPVTPDEVRSAIERLKPYANEGLTLETEVLIAVQKARAAAANRGSA